MRKGVDMIFKNTNTILVMVVYHILSENIRAWVAEHLSRIVKHNEDSKTEKTLKI
jgi:hypothetical protein